MSQKAILYGIGIILVGTLFLIGMNLPVTLSSDNAYKPAILSQKDVKGSAIIHKDILYTLNFKQQNSLVEAINSSISIVKANEKDRIAKPDFDRLVIYRFNQPDLEITPIEFDKEELVFSLNGKFFKEGTQGKLKHMLSETYDP